MRRRWWTRARIAERWLPLVEAILIAAVALGAGVLGSMLGLGGGVFLVPILSLVFGVPLKTAIAASAIAVVSNSASGSAVYLKARFTNVRLALVMLVAMVAGAIAGGFLAVSLPESILKGSFGLLLLYVSAVMFRRGRGGTARAAPTDTTATEDPHRLGGRYFDAATGGIVRYVPRKLLIGLPGAGLAGVASGMFGIGGGPITVPLYTIVMGLPMKAATSTSAFMFGLTASASALVYYQNDLVNPIVTVPAVLGIISGARVGAGVVRRIHPAHLNTVFVFVLAGLAISMLLNAFGVY
ncbi:MAG TPA: sulfite exporter TauE/SafE family protein [Thermomicrobiales bacterium]|nr:sulfite exporter TauE/SafE family protein [Chloroflexota bacterium]HBY46985.1 sulfite exporter TauE/SafE family protein [Chloroflexota bacterium]HQX63763.1 sulfite exporter TauE/SafE family protein [Thermomicrobiales bacterium]HQZ90007.1 sulfite exporter TauE/SafE family protein [Thermomicrobiales bacterium]HRA31185.1 sulfite exporter TauE/SafE family protein [Thermomicrobiales bacterium]